MKQDSNEIETKCRPPFTAIDSFNSCSTILSYMHFDVQVIELLNLLNHNSKEFAEGHRKILEGILVP